MKTDELVELLAAKAAPVQPQTYGKLSALLLALACAYLALLVTLFHERADLRSASESAPFLVLQICLAAIALIAILLFARLQAPGAKAPAWQPIFLWTASLGLLVFLMAIYFHSAPTDFATPAMVNAAHCTITVILSSILPYLVFLAIAKRQATVRPLLAGAMALLSSVAISSFAVDLACPNNHPLHILFFHNLLPLAALLAALLPFARKALRW